MAKAEPPASNKLYYGDNLDVLRKHIASESVDLVYLDPPFNSNRNYNVLFGRHTVEAASDAAQIQAFGDTWVWTPTTDEQYASLMAGEVPPRVADALAAFRMLLTENDAMAYLVNMAPRLVELHRVMKNTASLYLHCDPTMSHYLKILLDAIFGVENFRNEITWRRTFGHGNAGRNYGAVSDTILFYTKRSEYTWNQPFADFTEEYTAKRFNGRDPDGRRWQSVTLRNPSPRPNLRYPYPASNGTTYQPHPNGWAVGLERMERYDRENRLIYPAKVGGQLRVKQYLDETEGVKVSNVWEDIFPINSQAAERLGYPTQKPLALMERIIAASSNDGDVILDPFCGCGTTIDAAIKLKRRWIGIDVTYIAVDLIEKRLLHTYEGAISGTYEVLGIPRDMGGAHALFEHSPFDFERWAVSRINAQPNEKQVGDKGIDGVARFPTDATGAFGRILVSVKGGKTIGPQFVRDLLGTVQTQKAQMGVLITMAEPTRGILDALNHAGTYELPVNNQRFPKVQVITVAELLHGKRPQMPQTLLPYIAATKRTAAKQTDGLF